MKTGPRQITVSLVFLAFAPSVFTLTYGTDLTQEPAFYCPGYANCTGDDCRYNRIAPVSDQSSFNMSENAAIGCDSLQVEFNFPNSTDESFVGNETWTCFRYYDAVGHHLALVKISLDKPSGLNASDVECKASIGNCTLFNETSSEMMFVAGLPNNCIPWTDDLTEAFYCPGYANCTGGDCRYNRMVAIDDQKSFNKSEETKIHCDSLYVEFNFPDGTDESFFGNETWTCTRYYDAVGHHFALLKISLDKPSGLNVSDVKCKASIGNCILFKETTSKINFIAGLPDSCILWTDDLKEAPDVTTGDSSTVDSPTSDSSTVSRLEFSGVVAISATLFIRQYL